MQSEKPLLHFFASISNDYRISSTHICVFAALLYYRAVRGFSNPVFAYSADIMSIAKLSAPKTYRKCIKDLSEYGYLRYVPSLKKNQASRIYFPE
jgi:hypothetical protein